MFWVISRPKWVVYIVDTYSMVKIISLLYVDNTYSDPGMFDVQAVNLMRCEKCGGRHRRVPTDRPWYNARFCDRCNVRHSAKEVRTVFN